MDNLISRDCFIIAFTEIIRRTLKKSLPEKATERKFIGIAYEAIQKKTMHIKTQM